MTSTADNKGSFITDIDENTFTLRISFCPLNLTDSDSVFKKLTYPVYVSSGFDQAAVKCLCKY